MNDKIKHLLATAYKTDSIAKNKWRIENREQLREQRKKELKELMEKDNEMSNNKQSSVMTYNQLTFVQKVEYKIYCENKFGSTFIESEHGEPLFFSKDGQIINTKIIIDLLFNTNNN